MVTETATTTIIAILICSNIYKCLDHRYDLKINEAYSLCDEEKKEKSVRAFKVKVVID